MGSEGSESKKELIRFAIFCILVCTMWCVLYAVRLAPELTDPDCYLRLNRVQNLYEGGKWRGRSVRILTDTNFGPEMLYRTRHETIGLPYHRNYRGILDTYDIMTAGTDDAAHKLIEQRGIELILLCLNSPEFGDYSKPAGKTGFYQRLFRNECPNWLKAVELPTELSASL